MGKLMSRKLWLSVLTAICALLLALCGAIEWPLAIKIIAGGFGAYIGMEGLADAFGRLKSGNS